MHGCCIRYALPKVVGNPSAERLHIVHATYTMGELCFGKGSLKYSSRAYGWMVPHGFQAGASAVGTDGG